MPRTKREKVERVPVRIPKPMADEVDRIVREYEEYGWNRQRLIETSIAEMIMKVKSSEAVLVPGETYDMARKYYEDHKEELRIKHGLKNMEDFINFCVQKCFKEKGLI